MLLAAATTIFAEIQRSLNVIWQVPASAGSAFRVLVRGRLASLALIAVISFTVVGLLFAANYRILPNTYVSWRDAWAGAVVASLLFSLGKFAIAQYIGSTGVVSVLGAAGTPIVVLLWVYYSAQIFLLGAEVAKANADHRGEPHLAPAFPPRAGKGKPSAADAV